jgi:hypothetical protein
MSRLKSKSAEETFLKNLVARVHQYLSIGHIKSFIETALCMSYNDSTMTNVFQEISEVINNISITDTFQKILTLQFIADVGQYVMYPIIFDIFVNNSSLSLTKIAYITKKELRMRFNTNERDLTKTDVSNISNELFDVIRNYVLSAMTDFIISCDAKIYQLTDLL